MSKIGYLLNSSYMVISLKSRPGYDLGNLGPYSQHFTFLLAYEVRSTNTPNTLVLQYTRLERLARANILAYRDHWSVTKKMKCCEYCRRNLRRHDTQYNGLVFDIQHNDTQLDGSECLYAQCRIILLW